jgi:endonuclease YncB( thermonuclease family)
MKRLLPVLLLLILTGCELALPTAAPAPSPTPEDVVRGDEARVVTVIDGDTIDVLIGGDRYRVRYIGIDTPERDEPCYADASNANAELVAGRTVRLVKDVSDTDRYGRLLRYIYVDGVFVNETLIREGWAETVEFPPDTAYAAQFYRLEREARDAGLGCHPTGVFD